MLSNLRSCRESFLEVHFCIHSAINNGLHCWHDYLSWFSISQSDILLGACVSEMDNTHRCWTTFIRETSSGLLTYALPWISFTFSLQIVELIILQVVSKQSSVASHIVLSSWRHALTLAKLHSCFTADRLSYIYHCKQKQHDCPFTCETCNPSISGTVTTALHLSYVSSGLLSSPLCGTM